MANIYETATLNKRGQELYELSQAYNKNDVVKVVTQYVDIAGNVTEASSLATKNSPPVNNVQKTYYYYYARAELPQSPAHGSDDLSPTLSDSKWGGLIETEGKKVPEFIWTPSYSSSVNNTPTVQAVKYGDGYEQRVSDNINANLIGMTLSFDKRRKKEATAILHFFHIRAATESFLFSPPEPYNPNRKRLFVCRGWTNTFNFFDNYSISANFFEVAG
jgi:phage-related protein